MTTISNNRRRKRISPGGVFFIFILAAALTGAFFWRDALASVLWRVLVPVFSVRDQGAHAAGSFFNQFANTSELAAEVARLRAALASSSVLVMDRSILYAENIDLKKRLGRITGDNSILAAVVLRPPAVPYDTLTLDIGKNAGVKVGDLVSAEGSVFVGTITQVYDTASRAVLFSSAGQSYLGLLRGTQPISIAGQGGGSFVGELPVGTEVRVGEPVLLPGILPEYMARVTSVLRYEGESFQTIYLQLPVNPTSLRFVHIHRAAP